MIDQKRYSRAVLVTMTAIAAGLITAAVMMMLGLL